MLVLIGLIGSFWAAIVLIVIWGLAAAAARPIRQAYLNGMIPSAQRATILSFDSLMTSAGGIVAQPALGKAADAFSYPGVLSVLLARLAARAPLPAPRPPRRRRRPTPRCSATPANPKGTLVRLATATRAGQPLRTGSPFG